MGSDAAVRARRARVCARESARARACGVQRYAVLPRQARRHLRSAVSSHLIPSRSIPRPSLPDPKRAAVGGDRRHSRWVSAAQPRRPKARARRVVAAAFAAAGGRAHVAVRRAPGALLRAPATRAARGPEAAPEAGFPPVPCHMGAPRPRPSRAIWALWRRVTARARACLAQRGTRAISGDQRCSGPRREGRSE